MASSSGCAAAAAAAAPAAASSSLILTYTAVPETDPFPVKLFPHASHLIGDAHQLLRCNADLLAPLMQSRKKGKGQKLLQHAATPVCPLTR
jgi:hypothetical protein